VTGHGPPDNRHDRSAEDHKHHQDSRSAGVKPHDVVVTDLDGLEEAHLRPSQNDEVRRQSVVCGEQEVERQEERYDELLNHQISSMQTIIDWNALVHSHPACGPWV